MLERKSSLGRGAASIFSGVSQQSEDKSQISEVEERVAEKQESVSDIQSPNDDGLITEIQESSAETQSLKDVTSADDPDLKEGDKLTFFIYTTNLSVLKDSSLAVIPYIGLVNTIKFEKCPNDVIYI